MKVGQGWQSGKHLSKQIDIQPHSSKMKEDLLTLHTFDRTHLLNPDRLSC